MAEKEQKKNKDSQMGQVTPKTKFKKKINIPISLLWNNRFGRHQQKKAKKIPIFIYAVKTKISHEAKVPMLG